MCTAYQSEMFFGDMTDDLGNWSVRSCPRNSQFLIEYAKDSGWLKACLAKDLEFQKNKADLSRLSNTYILDKVYGIDFLVEFELDSGYYFLSIDVTRDLDGIEDKFGKSQSQLRKSFRKSLDLDGHLIVGIDPQFGDYSNLTKWEKLGLKATIEKAVINSSPWVRLEYN